MVKPGYERTKIGEVEESSMVRCVIRCLNIPGCTSAGYDSSAGRQKCIFYTGVVPGTASVQPPHLVGLEIMRTSTGEALGCPRAANCSEIKSLGIGDTDGEYIIYLTLSPVRVYCHSMSTTPKEYITLNSSENNYSLMDGRKMQDIFDCSPSGPFNPSPWKSQGLTNFMKVRLEISSLVIEVRDHTFAQTTVGDPVSYGHGGDCHGETNCHLGGFQIDLRGTCFMVRPTVQWTLTAYPTSLQIQGFMRSHNDQLIQAKCGGYCGTCEPENALAVMPTTC